MRVDCASVRVERASARTSGRVDERLEHSRATRSYGKKVCLKTLFFCAQLKVVLVTLAEGVNQSHVSQWHSAERGSHISVLARTYLSTAYPKTVGSLRQRAQNTQQAQNATTSTDGCNATLKTSTLQKHCLQSACKVRSNPNGMATGSLLTQNPAAWNSSSTVTIHM